MIVRPSVSSPAPREDGTYLISATLDEAIAFAKGLGRFQHDVDFRGVDPYWIIAYCEAEFGMDAVSSARDEQWLIEPDLTWTWNTTGVFHFTNEDDATIVALKFL